MSGVQQARERKRRQRARHNAFGARLKMADHAESYYPPPRHRSFLRQTRIDVHALVFLNGTVPPPLKRSIAVLYRAADLSPNNIGPLVAETEPELHPALWAAFLEEMAEEEARR